jgi:hypothetical protein
MKVTFGYRALITVSAQKFMTVWFVAVWNNVLNMTKLTSRIQGLLPSLDNSISFSLIL